MDDYTNQKCKWFCLSELLPPEIYCNEEFGWDMLCDQLKETIDAIRELLKVPLTCNDWARGGHRKNCGYRTQSCAIGARFSAHKQGMAADLISNKMTAQQMRQLIHDSADKLPYKIRIEANVSWLHVDVRTAGQTIKIKEFKA